MTVENTYRTYWNKLIAAGIKAGKLVESNKRGKVTLPTSPTPRPSTKKDDYLDDDDDEG